jgi:hypothetical protein
MSFDDLTLTQWRSMNPVALAALAAGVADSVGGRVVDAGAVDHLGALMNRVLIERGDIDFAFAAPVMRTTNELSAS